MPDALWLVQLFVDGPIAVSEPIHFQHPKGFGRRRQFYSDIGISGTPSGLSISVTAFANESDLARKAALVFVGEMLNVLATDLKEPLKLSLYDARIASRDAYSVKRFLTLREFKSAFGRARWLGENEPTFMRALGWFRKGLITEDPLDRFLAFWNSLEVVVQKYQEVPEGTTKGSKNRIRQAFRELWGRRESWPVIGDSPGWVNENNELRIAIAHGTTPVEIEHVEYALARADTLRDVAHLLLTHWPEHSFSPDYVALIHGRAA